MGVREPVPILLLIDRAAGGQEQGRDIDRLIDEPAGVPAQVEHDRGGARSDGLPHGAPRLASRAGRELVHLDVRDRRARNERPGGGRERQLGTHQAHVLAGAIGMLDAQRHGGAGLAPDPTQQLRQVQPIDPSAVDRHDAVPRPQARLGRGGAGEDPDDHRRARAGVDRDPDAAHPSIQRVHLRLDLLGGEVDGVTGVAQGLHQATDSQAHHRLHDGD